MSGSFGDFFGKNKWTILLVFIGLVFTILIFSIGFWRTILLCVILAVCFLLGYLLDRGGRDNVKSFFSSLFKK